MGPNPANRDFPGTRSSTHQGSRDADCCCTDPGLGQTRTENKVPAIKNDGMDCLNAAGLENSTECSIESSVKDSGHWCRAKATKEVTGCCDSDIEALQNDEACCDDSCIDRLALRQCKKECGEPPRPQVTETDKSPARSVSEGQSVRVENGACEHHTLSTRHRWVPLLEALGCICNALLACNLESCCSRAPPRPGGNGWKANSASQASTTLRPRDCLRCPPGVTRRKRSKRDLDPESPKQGVSKICEDEGGCSSTPAEIKQLTCSAKCCTDSEVNESGFQERDRDQNSKGRTQRPETKDLEKGSSLKEHVVLSVQGMTCTGCETKISQSLTGFHSIHNLQTSLVLGRAEFDLDLSLDTVENVIRQVERTTDLKCFQVAGKGHEVLVLATESTKSLIGQPMPVGVTDLTCIDKRTIGIYYDPNVRGIRDLLEHAFDVPLSLAPLQQHSSIAMGRRHLRSVGLKTMVSAMLTIPVLVLAWAPLPEHPTAYGAASLALATIIQVAIAGPFYPNALKSLLFARVIEMDLLIALSTTAAYVFSVVAFGYLVSGRPLSTGEFFETSTLLVSLIMFGRFVSALARQKAVESISVRSLQSTTALVQSDNVGEQEIDARLLQYGDVFKVAPESRIVTDGTVISGSSEVDESMITGETRPIEKSAESTVIAGSVNGPGLLYVRLTRLPDDNTISTIAGMIDEAKLSKPKTQEIADKIAGYFVPVIVILALVTFSIWIGVGITLLERSSSDASIQAITYAIAVLIVSCPCAIGLAVPMVVVIASGVAAEKGVIFKTAETIELAKKVSHVVFDKTGTLTQNEMSVVVEEYFGESSESTQSIILGLLSNVKHPVSFAVARHIKPQGRVPAQMEDVKTIPGKGVEGTFKGVTIRAGNFRWLDLCSSPQIEDLQSRGLTIFCIVINEKLSALFGLENSLRPDALSTISALIKRGISVSIVSGDDSGPVQSIATQLAIPLSSTKSRCSPGDKQSYLRALTHNNKSTILFCGDGTNDALALAQAHIGVHMNEGTDVAQGAADAVLMRPALSGILTLMDLSWAAHRRIVFNFAWAFVYNVFAILLAAGAFVHMRIPPAYAGLGEVVSVVPVVVIALQLRWARF